MTRGRPLPHSLFFQRKRTLQQSCHVPQVHFHCVFSGTMCLVFTSQCDNASPCRAFVSFPKGKRPSEESPGSFKAGRKTYSMWTKEFSHVCVESKKSDAAASTWAKDPQAPKKKSTSKRRYVETAGSEQTSSVFMLWAKTRVYICSGRAGGNERDLLFYVRYEETWHPHPTPPNPRSYVGCGCVASSHERQHPHPTPPNPRSYVACGCVASSHERQHPHPTPPNPRSYVGCGCVASSHERQHPHPTPPNPRMQVLQKTLKTLARFSPR